MSKNRNRARLSKSECGRDYHLISLNEWYPLYWDEGLNFHPYYKKGYKNPNKRIPQQKVREYKTWKYNRITKWKVTQVGEGGSLLNC